MDQFRSQPSCGALIVGRRILAESFNEVGQTEVGKAGSTVRAYKNVGLMSPFQKWEVLVSKGRTPLRSP